jgi:NADH dehydrogenase
VSLLATQLKIVVAGGTGFVGRYIVTALLAGGHDVTVLGRDPDKVARIPQLRGASARRGDVTDPASLRGALEGANAVVGAVGFPNYPVEQPRKGLTFHRFEWLGTQNLLAEATRSGVGRYVYVSGAGADPESERTWYRAKGLAEEAIAASGLSRAILRPSWGYGREDRALNKFVQMARFSPVIPKPGVRVQRIQPVYVEDIAEAVARIFATEDAWDRTFEIGGPEVLTMDEVIATMLEVLGKRRLVVPVPVPLLKIATAPLVLLPKPPMSPSGIDFAVQDGLVDTTDLEKVLDLHPMSLREGLLRYLPVR